MLILNSFSFFLHPVVPTECKVNSLGSLQIALSRIDSAHFHTRPSSFDFFCSFDYYFIYVFIVYNWTELKGVYNWFYNIIYVRVFTDVCFNTNLYVVFEFFYCFGFYCKTCMGFPFSDFGCRSNLVKSVSAQSFVD